MEEKKINMSKECKKARNVVSGTVVIFTIIVILLSMSSCGSTNKVKKCCAKTAQEVYEYEGLTIE
tara:strand:+ start:314 stop:508 length:195 start_codon:yes stop_codon:yes gene_type:complete